MAEALPPPHSDALALVLPGPLLDAGLIPFWGRRIAAAVGTAIATAACLAFTLAGENLRDIALSCWQRCAQFGANQREEESPVTVHPAAGEHYILVGPVLHVSQSSTEGARTPGRGPQES